VLHESCNSHEMKLSANQVETTTKAIFGDRVSPRLELAKLRSSYGKSMKFNTRAEFLSINSMYLSICSPQSHSHIPWAVLDVLIIQYGILTFKKYQYIRVTGIAHSAVALLSSGGSLICTFLALGLGTFASGTFPLRLRPCFPVPLSSLATSFLTRFARASSSSSNPITFALPGMSTLVDRWTLASLLIVIKNRI
jgi:hypothetical protein